MIIQISQDEAYLFGESVLKFKEVELDLAVEELSELIKAIMKYKRMLALKNNFPETYKKMMIVKPKNELNLVIDNIYEEIVDSIMQIKKVILYFDLNVAKLDIFNPFEKMVDYEETKFNRLNNILNEKPKFI